MIISNALEDNLKFDSDQLAEFNPNRYGLVFPKPIFDLAFIITDDSIRSKISNIQSHFQSKHKFTTHTIYLDDISRLKYCLSDLRSHDLSYAVVLNKNCERENSYDLYMLEGAYFASHTSISMRTVDNLISRDFRSLMGKVNILKCNPLKSPHPSNGDCDSLVGMNEELRYYLCLLFDNRILTSNELKYVKDYLLHRRRLLQQAMEMRPNLLAERPSLAHRPENVKYYVYDPITNVNLTQSQSITVTEQKDNIQPTKFIFKGPNRTSSVIPIKDMKPSEDYITHPSGVSMHLHHSRKKVEKSRETPTASRSKHPTKQTKRVTRWDTNIPLRKRMTVNKALIITNKYLPKPERINRIEVATTQISTVSYNCVKARVSSSHSVKKDNSNNIRYSLSMYYKNAVKFSTQKITRPRSTNKQIEKPSPKHDIIDLTADDGNTDNLPDISRKRPSNDLISVTPKVMKSETVKYNALGIFSTIEGNSDSLLNLFRLVMSLVPFNLPTENALYKIFVKYSIIIQDGIKEPSLKNVKVNYDACKGNGVGEIINNIYSVFGESQKNAPDSSYMVFVWNMYFPDHLVNCNLMVLFYRFVKLLMLYTMFNASSATKNLVQMIIAETDVVVNFDFNSPVSSFRKSQLNCFSTIFEKYFKEHDQLHILYSNLSNSEPLPLHDKRKKLDSVIKKKKIEFMLGPLLNYFVISINSIHQKMEPYQIEIIYGAIRTLRFCLRKINSKLAQITFNKPKSFDFTVAQRDNHYNEILRELKFLLQEIKYYQCILFTENHYEFVNCVLDFSWMVQGNLDRHSDPLQSKAHNDSLYILDSPTFIESFSSFDHPILLSYHPESELEYLKSSLKTRWADVLRKAFTGTVPEPCGWRIMKEMSILLPHSWGLSTFQEALEESARLYYSDYQKMAELDKCGWYQRFQQAKGCAVAWLAKYNLPVGNLDSFLNHQRMLESGFSRG